MCQGPPVSACLHALHIGIQTNLSPVTGQRSSGIAPDLRDAGKQQAGSSNSQQKQQLQQPSIKLLSPSLAKILYKRTLKSLASLPLAIGELFLLAGLSAIGTIIEQNKTVQFYQDAYPSGANKVLGFLTYHWIFALQWDHIYTAPYFLGLMALLGASLTACTTTRQLPMVRVARRYTSMSPLRRLLDARHSPPLPHPPSSVCVMHTCSVKAQQRIRCWTNHQAKVVFHPFAAQTLNCLVNANWISLWL